MYDPGGRQLSPRAWKIHKDGSTCTIVGPALKQTARVWGEPYRLLFAEGFGPGHSADGNKAEFDRFAWLVRRIAVACGFDSKSPLERMLRKPLTNYLRRSTASRVPDAMLHFEVVVSRLIRFSDTPERPDYWQIDSHYFWRSYGLDDDIYMAFRAHLVERGEIDCTSVLASWIAAARNCTEFREVLKTDYLVWAPEYDKLDSQMDMIPLID